MRQDHAAAHHRRARCATMRAACASPITARLGMVFQEPRLLPWRTLEQNVRLAAPQVTDADADDAVSRARPCGAPPALSGRALARAGAARGAGACLRGRPRSAAARRAVRLARRRAGGAAARRARRARDPAPGHDPAGHAQCRGGDRRSPTGCSCSRQARPASLPSCQFRTPARSARPRSSRPFAARSRASSWARDPGGRTVLDL